MAHAVLSVFNGRDNVEYLVIEQDGTAVADLSGVTRIQFVVGDTVIDSDSAPAETVVWNDQKTYAGATVDVVSLLLGHVGLTPGRYRHCFLILFDSANDDGAVWSRDITVNVYAEGE